ncbi:helix-turn-helix domain-containing protein [Streptomyces kanasensis]|uniref:helix-turn-helix domain-containing protein n=1 Tax=Streptomyces kanasensis TaxID=936756 RepID=UPI003827C2F7
MSDRERAPGPAEARDPVAFVARLQALKDWSGLTYRELSARAEAVGDSLPRSTVANMLARATLPREELLAVFVRACGAGPAETERWIAVREEIATREARAATGHGAAAAGGASGEGTPPARGAAGDGAAGPWGGSGADGTRAGGIRADGTGPDGVGGAGRNGYGGTPDGTRRTPGGFAAWPGRGGGGATGPGHAAGDGNGSAPGGRGGTGGTGRPTGPGGVGGSDGNGGNGGNGSAAGGPAARGPGRGTAGAGVRRWWTARLVVPVLGGLTLVVALTTVTTLLRGTDERGHDDDRPRVTAPAPGPVHVRAVHSGLCLNERPGQDSGQVYQVECAGADVPRYSLDRLDGGLWRLVTDHPDFGRGCSGAPADAPADVEAPLADQECGKRGAREAYGIEPAEGGAHRGHRVRNAATGLCVTVPDGERRAWTAVVHRPCAPDAAGQLFSFDPRPHER